VFEILHRVGIKASPAKVYGALCTPQGVAGWWTTDTRGDDQVGGTISFRFTAAGHEIGAFDMQILELQPDVRVAWQVLKGPPEWLGSTIRFELRKEGEFTVVLFRHEGWKEPAEFMYHCSTKWAIFLMSLKSLVETGRGDPSPRDVRIGDWH
jgi:uncharacterized protein YndB with AHSA1/START domain